MMSGGGGLHSLRRHDRTEVADWDASATLDRAPLPEQAGHLAEAVKLASQLRAGGRLADVPERLGGDPKLCRQNPRPDPPQQRTRHVAGDDAQEVAPAVV